MESNISKKTPQRQAKATKTKRTTRQKEFSDDELERRIKSSEQKTKKTDNEERYYVTNAQLLEELTKWRDSAEKVEDRCVPSDELGRMFMEIARRISNHSFFRNYTLEVKQDLIGYALEKMVSGMKNYNFKYTNAFAYFSQAAFNAFKTQLAKHYKQLNIKRDLTKKAIIELDTYLPNSSMSKCLGKQFAGNDFDDFSDF